MKQYNKYFKLYTVLFVIGSCLFTISCTDENIADKKGKYKEGIPVSLTLSFKPNTPEVITRAGENMDNYADNVSDITVFAFNALGDRIGYKKYPEDGKTLTTTLSDFNTISGENYIYAVANLSSSNYTTLAKTLEDCTNKEMFTNMAAKLSQNVIDLVDTKFLMSGVYGDNDGYVDIAPEMTTLSSKIKLQRVIASIKFSIHNGTDVTFTPQSWQVVDIPDRSFLIGRTDDKDWDNASDSTNYFPSPENSFAIGQGEFTFYMMENRKKVDVQTDYKDRFKNKPKNATYLILKGYYKGPADKYPDFESNKTASPSNAVGNVIYYIPLGEATQNSKFTDYRTERNTQYSYKVTVNGVHDIVLEVVKNTPTSVADGDLIYTDAEQPVIQCDAHYVAKILTFQKNDIIGTNTKWTPTYRIKTPKTSFQVIGPKNENLDDNEDSSLDDKWIHFVINTSDETSPVLYPGDGNPSLLTVKQLLTKLKDENSYLNNKITVTAFIDEYYYNDTEWWKFANKPNREMMILCKTKTYNKGNNNSSLTDAAYVLSQRSIQTYFVTDGTADYAVGIEWENETTKFEETIKGDKSNYSYGISSSFGNTDDGRANMIKELKQSSTLPSWEKVPYLSGNLSNYNTAYNACMTRNRNSNSTNEQINVSEIKWFLPSLPQYQDFVIGQDAYNPAAILFPANTKNTLHFYANTQGYGGGGEPWRNILWAEEGISTSGPTEYKQKHPHSIRCMRYLGKLEKPDDTEMIKINKVESNKTLLVLNKIDKMSIRNSYSIGELGMHTEVDENNKPYKEFWVYNSDKPAQTWTGANVLGYYSPGFNENTYNDKSSCTTLGEGWRIPNQRELTLLLRVLEHYNNEYVARTKYSGKDKTGYDYSDRARTGFLFSNGGMGVSSRGDKASGYIRCVKDNY